MKTISVVIPVYNVEKYLDRCVASLINQPYKNLEIILVDDGSPDNCPAMCDEWAKKDSRIKVVHKINGGVSSARNVGIDVSTGDYITFVDSDDYVNNAFSQAIEEVISNDMQIAFVPLEKLDCSKEIVLNDSNFHQILKDNSIAISSPWSKLFKRDLLEQNKFLEGVTVAEDKEFIARLLTKCEKINIINTPFYTYFTNDESVTNNKGYKLTVKLFDSIQKIMKNIDTYEVSETTKQNIKEVFASHLYCIFRYYPNCTKSEKKHIKSLIKQNKQIFSLTQERGKKIVYYTLKLFGVGFAIATLRLLRKFKIVK